MDGTRDIRGIVGGMMEEQVEEGREIESEAEEVVVLEEVLVLEEEEEEEEVEEVVVFEKQEEEAEAEEEEEEEMKQEEEDEDEEEEEVEEGMEVEEEENEDDEAEEQEEAEDDDDDEEEEDDFETALDIVCYINEKISHPALKSFLSFYLDDNNLHSTIPPSEDDGTCPLGLMEEYLNEFEKFLMTTTILVEDVYYNQQTMEHLLSIAHRVEHLLEEIVPHDSGKQFNSRRDDLKNDWNTIVDVVRQHLVKLKRVENRIEDERVFLHKVIDQFINSPNVVKDLEMLLFDKADSSESITLEVENEELLLIKALPAFLGLKESSDKVNFLLETIPRLKSFYAEEICQACDRQPRIVLLIGGLLSFKSPDSDIWQRVYEEVGDKFKAASGSTDNFMEEIYRYCFTELHSNIQDCFQQLACYPIGYEISIASLTKIWIAEGFIKPKIGETKEETSYKYVEELAQRSLIWVSRISLSGTIKYLRVPRSTHQWIIKMSRRHEHLIVNPDYKIMRSWARVAIHNDDKNQYTEVRCNKLHSFLAFHIDRNVLRSARFLEVLELRNCVVGVPDLEKMPHLRYLGLRGSNISKLPENIGNMKDLQTLDVRDTNIEILPESLWNISALRHVYVNPGPRIQGPPPTANIPNLQILKTVGVPESWPEKVPHLPINLRKLALSYVGHLELETISNPLSRMVNLLSISIKAPLIPAELVDTRAFPNLDTLKSIEFVGIWNFRKLPIDNVAFPSNLAKLILSNSRLKEDPMPRLERLQALKLLKLEDGAYTGEKMICSANGFPQLQFLQLSQLENLKIWEVKTMAMSNLSTLRVVKCRALKISLPDLEHVKDIVIDN